MNGDVRSAQRTILLSIFRDAAWLNSERLRLWQTAFAILWILVLAVSLWNHARYGITDVKGEFLGGDFINYWSGARLAANGRALLAYDIHKYHAWQMSFAGPRAEFKNYAYPPTAMLLSLPLALLPYVPGLILWLLAGTGLAIWLLSRDIGYRSAFLAVLASPAVFINLYCGQNGLFTAAIFAGGIGLLERRPLAAGFLFGLLCYKPQLGILLPVALAAGGYWRCFLAAAVTVGALCTASMVFPGTDAWPGFFEMMHFQNMLMQVGKFRSQPTVFSAVNLLATPMIAYAAQAISTAAAAAVVFFIWRCKQASIRTKGAALILAAFLATPYAWDYDMVMLTFAAVWVTREALVTGFQPWQKIIWMSVILIPIPLMAITKYTNVQLAPLLLWLALLLVFRTARERLQTAAGIPA